MRLCVAVVLLQASTALSEAPRFAVCLIGSRRSFRFTESVDNVKRFLVDALPGPTDVFLAQAEPFSLAHGDGAALAALGVVEAQYGLSQRGPVEEKTVCFPRVGFAEPGITSHLWVDSYYRQSSKVGACFAAALARERATGVRYAYLVRSRLDLVFRMPVSTWLQLDPEAVNVGWALGDPLAERHVPSDHFAVVPRRHAARYGRAAELLQNCSLAEADVQAWGCHVAPAGPECLLGFYLRLAGIPYFACYPKDRGPPSNEDNLFVVVKDTAQGPHVPWAQPGAWSAAAWTATGAAAQPAGERQCSYVRPPAE